MTENVTKLPVKREAIEPSFTRGWHPFESLHREIDRLFDDFGMGFRWPFGRSLFAAEPLFRRALAIYEQALGPNHPDTVTCLNNLAYLLEEKGNLGEAEELRKRTCSQRHDSADKI